MSDRETALDRCLLALAAALALQVGAAIAGFCSFALMFGRAMNGETGLGWWAVAGLIAVGLFVCSGWAAARAADSRWGWIVLGSPVLVWLAGALIVRT